jgi:hypothetical protein
MANGWNQTLKVNRSYTFGAQVMVKPVDQAIFYLGYAGGPQNSDFAPGVPAIPPAPATPPGDVPEANDHWRHIIDFVADINPTSSFRALLNFDYRAESSLANVGATGTHDESVIGGNLVLKYAFSDAFSAAIRGEYYHDEHGDTLATGAKTDVVDGTLSLVYGVGNHLAFMLDGRYDSASVDGNSAGIFPKNASDVTTGQFTAVLGVIASTK